jgi:protoporphyrinogen IX oxidase
METLYRVTLSIHLIAVISWMAGILYLYRLFIYHTEEREEIVMARFRIMETKLYRIITMPAMGVAFIAGTFMLTLKPALLLQPWLHGKLLFVAALIVTTVYAGRLRERLERGEKPFTSKQLRFLNELPTLLMIAIVFLVILKPWNH